MKNQCTNSSITGKKPRLFTLNFSLIFFSTLCMMMIFQSFNSTLPAYVEEYSGTVKYAGIAVTALTIAAVISRPVTGYLLDKKGRGNIYLIGLLLFLIPTLAFIGMIPVAAVIVLRFVQGIGFGMGHTASNTIAMDLVPRKRLGEGVGLYSLSFSISMAVGPALALWIIEYHSFRELFIISSGLVLLSIFLALLIRYPRSIENKRQDEEDRQNIKFAVIEKKALYPSLVGFLIMFTSSSVTAFLYLFAQDINIQSAGLFFSVMAVSTILSRPIAGLIMDRSGPKGNIFNISFSIILLIFSLIIVSYSKELNHLLIGGLLFGFGGGFSKATLLAITVLKVPAIEKGRAIATYWTFVDLGVSLGAFFWGFIASISGYQQMYLLTTIPLILAFIVYYWGEIRPKLIISKHA